MELDQIVRRFGELCGLPAEEAEAQRELCGEAMARVEELQNGQPGGEEALTAYAAAVACRRYVLRCLMAGGVLSIGDPLGGPAGARSAAEALEEEYRRGASRWLVPPEFCFRRTPGAGGRITKGVGL